ncbi:ATP-dependent Clp protease proteolytic subunit [Pirellulimonas nuda]|uniref:ATP-dependent Clp protease proteolytic subunit n=1 Tax=Pirellulimonas nuda TaxID=2528009 RepID=A0A518D9I2_9BACT|nr:ATP-dependent Clp protease proteolytic subunit [Pirellulimonas nuda]QDU88145.1 ATP-dependent Clp protease proteolytic subunit [Pirellulimonas nuda]
MLSRLLFAFALFSFVSVGPQAWADEAPPAQGQQKKVPFKDLPDEMKEKIREAIEKNDRIPDEVKEKLRKATEEGGLSSFEEGESASSEVKPTEKKEDAKKEEEKKPQEPSLNDKVKELREKMQQMDTEFQYKVAEYKARFDEQRLAIEKAKLDRQIADAQKAEEEADKEAVRKQKLSEIKAELELSEYEAKLAKARHEADLMAMSARKARAEAELATLAAEEKFQDAVIDERQYPDQPFKNGVLTISDRRIELNGAIFDGAAKYVCDRIDYYNNESDKPIFLIIDSSPGGSGVEGLQIVQAMKHSKAPVHVVVKRFAASMAAIITTLADESYAYPGAILLHHQASSGMSGNTTQQKESLDRLREMSDRLVGAVAEKIGTTEDQFVEQMYKNRSTGDWDLFADEALKQGWVDHVVDEIRETAVRSRPTGSRSTSFTIRGFGEADADVAEPAAVNAAMERYDVRLSEQQDDKGRRFVRLPRLGPMDHWFLYNPDEYYR